MHYCTPNESDLSNNIQRKSLIRLRLVGENCFPATITLAIETEPFIIGRYDNSVGHKQCDFEFRYNAIAVSRRHAAIERVVNGYVIVDLNSRAGTFLNGNRIITGEQYLIMRGDVVSFGNAGADYIVEEHKLDCHLS